MSVPSTSQSVRGQNEPDVEESDNVEYFDVIFTEPPTSTETTTIGSKSCKKDLDKKIDVNTIGEGEGDTKEPEYIQQLRYKIENNIDTDCKVIVGNKKFDCHLIVLRASSETFKEQCCGRVVELPVEHVTAAAFREIYEWMKTDKPKVRGENVIEFFRAVLFLKVDKLIKHCWSYFRDEFFVENEAFGIFWEARPFTDLIPLQKMMLYRVRRLFLTLVSTMEFLEMDVEPICFLLSKNCMGTNSEVEVFFSAIYWLSDNWPHHAAHVKPVMECIRYGLLPVEFLISLKTEARYELSPYDEVLDAILDHPILVDMINEGLNLAMLQASYIGEDADFKKYLKRYEIELRPRKWIYDPECPFHDKNTTGRHNVPFEKFRDYIEKLQDHDELSYLDRIQYVS